MLRDRFEPAWVKAMIGILALVVAAAAVFVFIWVVPSSEISETDSTTDGSSEIIARNNDGPAESNPPENDGEGAPEEIPDEPEAASEEGHVEEGPDEEGPAEEGPDIVIELPPPEEDPSQNEDPGPDNDNYEDVYGSWILNMAGSFFGLKDCHLDLDEEGKITCPSSYDVMMEIEESEYKWEKGKADFHAVVQVMVKIDYLQVTVPAKIELKGIITDSLLEVEGDFVAIPLDESFAEYGEEGRFVMKRGS